MRMPAGLDSEPINVTRALRQQGALETSTIEQFETIRTVAGSADATFSFGVRAARPAGAIAGDRYYATDRQTLYVYSGTAWEVLVGFDSGTDATRAAITPDATDNGMFYFVTDTGKLWEVSGAAWVDRFVSLDATTSYKVGGTKVIGAQGAAVTDPTGGAVIDVECRAQLALLLARVRASTGHGLIA